MEQYDFDKVLKQGQVAYESKKPLSACPFSGGDKSRTWRQGWKRAQYEASGKEKPRQKNRTGLTEMTEFFGGRGKIKTKRKK